MRYRLGIMVAAATTALCASTAQAAPGDLDPSFGTAGVAQAAAGRTSAQGAPVVLSDGRVLVVGLSSGKAVIERFTSSGVLDTTFGTGGEVVTDITAPNGRVAVADAGGGAFQIVGIPSGGGSKVVLERFTSAGALSSSASVNVPGSLSYPAAAVVRPDGSTYVANKFDCGSGVQCFGVLKFKGSSLDSTFAGGYVKTKVGSMSQPLAIAVTTGVDGKDRVTVAGSLGTVGTATSDTALVRYLSTGLLDTTFGTAGIKTIDESGNNGADNANGIIAEPGGGVTVTGAAGNAGYVARFTSTGAADGSFGTGGILRGGFAAPTATYQGNALTTDSNGRYVVAGQAKDPTTGTTKWALSRLSGAGAFDTTFGSGGTAQYTPCANTAGFGPAGVSTSLPSRIHLSGSCNSDGRVAAARVLTAQPFSGGLSSDVAGSNAAGYERLTIAGLNPTTVLGSAAALLSTDLRANAIRPNPIRPNALRPNALRPNPLVDSAIRPNPISGQILLSDFPLSGTTWEDVLAGYVDKPIQSLTLADVFALNPLPPKVAALSLADVDLNRSPLRNVSAAAFMLSLRPLASLPAPSGGWCAYLAGKALDCTNGASTTTTTLIDLERAGDDLTSYYATPIGLAAPTNLGTGSSRAPLSYIKLTSLDLSRTPIGPLPARLLSSILACGSTCTGTVSDQQNANPSGFSTADVGTLVTKLPIKDGTTTVLADLTLGQVMNGLVDPQAIPFEAGDMRALLNAADFRSTDLQTYTLTFNADCTAAPGLAAAVDTPDDARIVLGSAALTVGGVARPVSDPTTSNGVSTFDLTPACAGATGGFATFKLTFKVEPGSDLGPQTGSATVSSGGSSINSTINTTVDDSHDPGSTFDDVQPIGTDKIVTGHIADGKDVDYYSFPAPPPGSQVTFTLSHIPQGVDYDLSVFGAPEGIPASAIRPNALRPNAIRPNPGVPDASQEQTDPSLLAPDTVSDIAIRPNAIRPNPIRPNSLRTNSITRGSGDEAASVVSRDSDQGTQYTVAVTSYNGGSSPKPYVLRVKVADAAPEPPCAPQPTLTSGTAPNSLPSNVDPNTKALILVNQQRMAARYSNDSAVADVLARAQQLAQATGGLVVPLDVPRTDDAYKAWDADPCSPAKADAVVSAINGAVDAVRSAGGGLPKLRSILIVGGDQIIPQARVADRTVIANEADFADSIVFRAQDNPQSRAAREHYLLSDDPIGDFDPSNDGFYVPDVALGRLVETPAQMRDQMDRFLSPSVAGRVQPTRSFVTGYDFLADGAQAVNSALTGAVPAGSAASLINETWTASQAQAGANASGAAFESLNGHYDQYRALSAAGNATGSTDVLNASAVTPPAGSVLFTVGCHSGLNLSFALSSPTTRESQQLGDWAEQMSADNALFTGNTGFGYGDTEAVAYSETLMAAYARYLAGGQVSTGQALMFAKQQTAAQLTATDAYWQKASMESTYYGIPMYLVGPSGTEAGSALPPDPPPASAPDTRVSTSYTVNPVFDSPHVTDRGTYYVAKADSSASAFEPPLVIQHRPVEPKVTVDVTPSDAAPVHGALLEGLTTSETTGVNPVIARPTIDLESHEPEPDATAPFFPAQLLGVEPQQTPQGLRDQLTLIAGQTRGTTQRLITQAKVRVFRSYSTDFTPPTIQQVDGLVTGNSLSVGVSVLGGDEAGGIVLYRTNVDGTWHTLNLSSIAPGRMSGGDTLGTGVNEITEALVYVYDKAGNVGESLNKVLGYAFKREPSQPGDPKIVFTPPTTSYYSTPPSITIDPGTHSSATFEYSVDGGPWTLYTGAFTITGTAEGEHLIAVRGSDGSGTRDHFAVDTQPPTVTGEPARAANSFGWYNSDVLVRFTCADAVSGVATCSPPVTIGEGANQFATGTSTDNAGHTGTGTVGPINVDKTAPTISGSPDRAPNADGWYNAPVTVTWTCNDALSGIVSCPGPSTVNEAQDGSVSATTNDKAGNSATGTVNHIRVDRTDPTVTITSPGILLLSKVTGTASDADSTPPTAVSGIKDVLVTYTNGNQTVTRSVGNGVVLSCDATGANCTWTADPPSLGIWNVSATATDKAGRSGPTAQMTISVNLVSGSSGGSSSSSSTSSASSTDSSSSQDVVVSDAPAQ